VLGHTVLDAIRDAVQVCAVRVLGAPSDEPLDVGHVADLDSAPAQAVIPAWRGAGVAGLEATTAIGFGFGFALVGGLGVRVVGAEGQLEAVLRQVAARGAVGARADLHPVVGHVADLDALLVGRAAIGAELAGGRRRWDGGDGGDESGGGDDVLHFEEYGVDVGSQRTCVGVVVAIDGHWTSAEADDRRLLIVVMLL
jgi:hypothetical protein